MENKSKYYSVLRGRKTGVYAEWGGSNGARAQIFNFRGSRFKSFDTLAEAQVWLKDNEGNLSEQEPMTPKQRRQIKFDQKLEGYRKDDTAIVYCHSGEKYGRYGWGVDIDHPRRNGSFSGGFRMSTRYRMALYAILKGLQNSDGFNRTVLVTDNEFIVKAFRQDWPSKWQNSNWRKWDRSSPKNVDLWMKLLPLYEKIKPVIVLIPAGVSVAGNNRARLLAQEACNSKNLRSDPGYEPRKNKSKGRNKWMNSVHPLNSAPKYSFSI